MFILDSLLIGGIRWALDKAITAAEAELNDDSTLREALLEAEMRREMGEISDDEFAGIEADLLARIREIKERREGGTGPIAFGAQPIETSPGSRFEVEATVSGDFHDPAEGAHAHVIDTEPVHETALAHLVDAHGLEQIAVIDTEPAAPSVRPRRSRSRTTATKPTLRTGRTSPPSRTRGRRAK